MEQLFNYFLIGMALVALAAFVALYFIDAGYGRFYTKQWGPSLDNRLGWMLMEAPVFIAMALLWWFSDRRTEPVPLCLFLLFELHYLQRAFIFPYLIKGRNRMPLSIVAMAVLFNMCNALMQGGWIFYVAPADFYPADWFAAPQFIVGCALFFVGMGINIQSDGIIRRLRTPGDSRHYLPRGGMFRYVSSANYFGELLEWGGYALLCWSWAGAVFFWWTFANLAPRAARIYNRYDSEFGDEFRRLRLKRILPFIY